MADTKPSKVGLISFFAGVALLVLGEVLRRVDFPNAPFSSTTRF